MNRQFRPNRTADLERRLQHIERFLVEAMGAAEAAAVESGSSGGGSNIELPISEHDTEFDGDEGHIHDGDEGGTRIPHANLTTPGSALLDGAAHSDTEASTPVAGDLVYASSTPLWKRLAIGTATYVLKVTGGLPAWGQVAHGELAGAGSALLDGSQHSDTLAGAVARGALICGDSTPKWARLLIGAANRVLKSDGTDAAWGQVAHGELAGTGSALLDGSQHSDTAAGAAVRGGLIYGNATPAWARLLIGAANRVLKSDGTDLAWGQVAHGELSGTGSALLDGAAHSDTAAGSVTRGDLIYGNSTPKWARLAKGTSGQFLSTDGVDVLWDDIPASVTPYMLVGVWWEDNLTDLTTSMTQIANAWAQGAGGVPQASPEIAGLAGTITKLALTCDGDVDGGGVESVTVEIYKNGVATGETLTVTGTSQAGVATVSVSVAATDLITVYAKKSAVGIDAQVMTVRVIMTPS